MVQIIVVSFSNSDEKVSSDRKAKNSLLFVVKIILIKFAILTLSKN